MDKPILDLTQRANKEFYAFIGRVSLLLVEYNVDAITAATFVRCDQGVSKRTLATPHKVGEEVSQ